MTFNEAQTILEALQAKYEKKPELLEAACYALRLAAPNLRCSSQDDGTVVLHSSDETQRVKLKGPKEREREG